MSTTTSPALRPSCKHALLRRLHGSGLCPICHAALIAAGVTKWNAAARAAKERERREAARCKTSLAAFFRASWKVLEPTTPLEDSWLFDVLALHFEKQFHNWRARKSQAIIDPNEPNPLQNLLVNLPPGTAKSRFFSVAAPAWAWLHDPTVGMMAVSTNPNVVKRDADLLRSLINSAWYKDSFAPQWIMREDKNAVGMFQLQSKTGRMLGWRKSSGITARIIGERADLIVVDDPHDPNDVLKGKGDALAGPIASYSGSVANRLNNMTLSMRVVVAHRVHKNDLSGHLLTRSKQKWVHLEIAVDAPAEQTKNATGWIDPRKQGERLLPRRLTDTVLAEEQENFGDMYDALYKQRPPDFGNAIFKGAEFRWFRFEDRVPYGRRPAGASTDPARVLVRLDTQRYFDRVAISVDANFAKTNAEAKGSRVGLHVWGWIGHDKFLIDVRSAALGFNETVEAIAQCLVDYPEADIALVEDKANGNAIMSQLQETIPEVVSVSPDGSKEGRARATTGQVKAGRVYIQEGQPWNEPFCQQVFSFPFTPDGRDDDVDTMTQFLNWVRSTDYSDRLAALAGM